jgi:hypothetical protein
MRLAHFAGGSSDDLGEGVQEQGPGNAIGVLEQLAGRQKVPQEEELLTTLTNPDGRDRDFGWEFAVFKHPHSEDVSGENI